MIKVKKQPNLKLNDSIEELQGVGQKTADKVKKLGIKTIYDLLTYFPFRYSDFAMQDLSQAKDKQGVSLYGTLTSDPISPKRTYCKMRLAYGKNPKQQHFVTVMFFHKSWLSYKFHQNDHVLIYGKYSANYHTVSGQRIKKLDHKPSGRDILQPKYSLTSGLKQYTLQKMIKQAYVNCINQVKDTMPKKLKDKYKLEDLKMVIHDLQFPKSMKAEYWARRTFKFDELYKYEVKIQEMKQKTIKSKGIAINYNPHVLRNFDNSLPFTMTSGQIRSVRDIVLNLKAPTKMNRLLQGDVGSGKTIVAAFGILATISAGYQCALMVPTGVLAKQHAKSFTKVFKGLGINIGLLTGDIKPKQKETLLKHLANGDIQLIIGTDALIWPDVKFKKLGMAVIDEQHKFGVDQRKALMDKGKGVNTLAMTATPIPRTLAITAYGDMSLSVIDTLPKGRKPVRTKWIYPNQFKKVIPFMKKLLAKGQQAYIVVPLVKQNEKNPDKNKLDSITAYHTFSKIFKPFKVGLLHGQMDDDKKDKVMADFSNHKFDILVATTVIEVGISVKDATMMIIFSADSEGLSQLHQLRGRCMRGSHIPYCFLIARPKTENGKKRMLVMENTSNGFTIAAADLKIRGAGDITGETGNQSGVPHFKCADVVNDSTMLNYATMEAQQATLRGISHK